MICQSWTPESYDTVLIQFDAVENIKQETELKTSEVIHNIESDINQSPLFSCTHMEPPESI